MITSGVETITPEIAKELLSRNSGNRSINDVHVNRLAKQMSNNQFDLNGDAIRITDDGSLIDGQHRLSACVKSGVSFQSLIVRGLPKKAFLTIDQGKHRSHGDTLSALGEKNGKDISSALKIIERYFTAGLPVGRKNFTNSDMVDLLDKYPDVRSCLGGVTHPKGLFPRSIAIACNYLFRIRDEELASRFFDELISGTRLDEGSPVYILRERLMRNAMSKAKLKPEYIMALMIKAWNALRSGREIKSLRFRENGDGAESFPIVQ